MTEIVGYHGASRDACYSIKTEHFKLSRGEDHWLGEGVYFFEEGIGSSASDHAKEWAICSAWCNDRRMNTYDKYGVIKAVINFKNLWDLTTEDGLKAFNYVRKQCLAKLKSKKPGMRGVDNEVISVVAAKMRCDGIRAWFYIKTSRQDRRMQIGSGIPNTVVVCVTNPQVSISLDAVSIIAEGFVSR